MSLLMACHSKEQTNKKFLWYLDTSCSNHMSGEKPIFFELDEAFRDVVKFNDVSTVSIMGKGKVVIKPIEILFKLFLTFSFYQI